MEVENVSRRSVPVLEVNDSPLNNSIRLFFLEAIAYRIDILMYKPGSPNTIQCKISFFHISRHLFEFLYLHAAELSSSSVICFICMR